MRKTLILITLSLGVTAVIFLYSLKQPLRDGDKAQIWQQVTNLYLEKISTLACLLLTAPPNLPQDNSSPTLDDKRLSNEPLQKVSTPASVRHCQSYNLGLDEQIWGDFGQPGDKEALLRSIDYSLRYLQTSEAAEAYQEYPVDGITRDGREAHSLRHRIFRSLLRFRQLVLSSSSATELEAAVKREFVFYQSVGGDGRGTVLFTAYYEPIYAASRVPTAEYRYPIYRQPPDLSSWSKPHPTRKELEGIDGLQGSKGPLRGLELFWLRSRLDAYIAQIQGSARLMLTDGTQTSVNYADNTAYDYSSIGRELVRDGKFPLEGLTMPIILRYFSEHPTELNNYVPRDRSFVFFQENYGAPAQGSIHVPLTASRSIATDKSLMPPGALALIRAPIPFKNASGVMENRTVSRYVLDQDTGGAIKGPGRVDYFLGSGYEAGERAGVTVADGQLFYLLLKQ